jgi:hypothetical protein
MLRRPPDRLLQIGYNGDFVLRVSVLLTFWAVAASAQSTPPPLLIEVGGVKLRPGGFFDVVVMPRSATTADNIYTHFGAIPLTDTPGETLFSIAHSRVQLRGDVLEGPVKLTGYVESDFLNPIRGNTPYRWRQYWGAVSWGKWEILGGRAWSMLRPNRIGIASDTGVMNTLVVEPSYHVGIVGSRNRQFRLARTMGDYHAVVAWETLGNFLFKATADKKFGHVELVALKGRHAATGVSAAATLKVAGPVRFITQEYWSKHAASQALSIIPAGINGGSALEGFEIAASRHVDLYTYAGWVYGARSKGNRVVREYTVGGDYRIFAPSRHTIVTLGLQLSRMDRALWTPQSGEMYYALVLARFSFN